MQPSPIKLPEHIVAACEAQSATAIAATRELDIVYVNRAWFEFARANEGERTLETWGPGRNLLDAITEPLRAYYAAGYANVVRTGEPWEHTYECSSPTRLRRFHMLVRAIDGGLLALHSPQLDVPHAPEDGPALLERYASKDGIVVQCAHCRRVRRVGTVGVWDWVPDFVGHPPKRLSHGLCSPCARLYFPT